MNQVETLRNKIALLLKYEVLNQAETITPDSFVSFWENNGGYCELNCVLVPVYHQYHVKQLPECYRDMFLGRKAGDKFDVFEIEACFNMNGALWKVPTHVWPQIWGIA